MATKIKDAATAEKAALKLNEGIEVPAQGEPSAPKEKSTSEKLFPEFITDDGGVINRPVKPFQDTGKPLPASATPTPESQGQTNPTVPPTQPSYITEADLKGKLAKLKVDGIEQDVPAESLIKTNQLERHLNAQLMTLAQERKALEDERRRLAALPPTPEPLKLSGKQPESPKKTPEVEAMEARYLELQQQIASLQQTMLPAIQESGIKRVEQRIKSELGTEDFRTYFEKIRDSALAQLADPQIANDPNARRYFDSDAYYFEKYKELKLKEMLNKPATPAPIVNPNAPALISTDGAPVIINNNGKPVSIPTFESSGGVPSRVNPDANWQSTYTALFQRAQKTGAQEDWMAFYRHKVRPAE